MTGSVRHRLAVFLRQFVAGVDPDASGAGWATHSLFDTLRNAMLSGTLGLQSIIWIGLVTEVDDSVAMVALGVLLLVCCATTAHAIRARMPGAVVVATAYALGAVVVGTAESPDQLLVFTGNWLILVASGLAAVLVSRWPVFVVQAAGCLGYSWWVATVHPEWGATIPQGQIIAGYSILLALRSGIAVLGMVAARADERTTMAERELGRNAWLQATSQEAAENARTLHDTVINTLAALASGGHAVSDPDLVRERCARDRATIEALQCGARPVFAGSFLASLHLLGIEVRRQGLEGEELEEVLAGLQRATVDALERATHEASQNAAKHAGVWSVLVEVGVVGSRLRIRVIDDGIGFEVEPTLARGALSSVVGRAEAAGLEVDIDSSPGSGTTVVFAAPLSARKPDVVDPTWLAAESHAVEDTVSAIRRGAVWMWALGVLLVGIALEVTSQPGRWTPTYVALALGFAALIIGWVSRKATSPVRHLASGMLIVLAGGGFLFSAATSRFGQDDPVLWQVLVSTGTLIVCWSRSRAVGLLAGATHALAAVGAALAVAQDSSTAALITFTGGLIGVMLLVGFAAFVGAIDTVGQRLTADRRQMLAGRLESRQQAAAADARRRWRDAGLERAHALLDGVAHGALRLDDEALRRRCGVEESYLRNLIQLNPDLVLVGPWFVNALASARERQVDLVLRGGDVDPPSERVAEQIGRLTLAAVELSGTAGQLTATLRAGGGGGAVLMLVTARGCLEPLGKALAASDGEVRTHTTLGEQDLVEVAFAGSSA